MCWIAMRFMHWARRLSSNVREDGKRRYPIGTGNAL